MLLTLYKVPEAQGYMDFYLSLVPGHGLSHLSP